MREYAGRHSFPLAAIVPYDEAVVSADERGLALIEHRPDAPSVTAIRGLADRLLDEGAGAPR
jgi:nitrogenase subunit NifH